MQVTNADKKPEVVKSWTKRSRCFQFDETQFLSSSGVSRWLCTAFPAWSKTPWNSCYIGRWPCYPWSSRIWSAANLVGRHCQSTHISGNDPWSSKGHHDECIWESPPHWCYWQQLVGTSTTCHHHCLRWIYFSSEINYMYPADESRDGVCHHCKQEWTATTM